MLTIRFFRTGRRNQPFFRLVVTDKKNPPKGGRFLEVVGFFNPKTKEKNLNKERLKHWLKVGAQPSDRAHNLLVGEGLIKAKKRPVHARSKKKKETEPPETKKEEAPQEKPKQPEPEVKTEPKTPEAKEAPSVEPAKPAKESAKIKPEQESA